MLINNHTPGVKCDKRMRNRNVFRHNDLVGDLLILVIRKVCYERMITQITFNYAENNSFLSTYLRHASIFRPLICKNLRKNSICKNKFENVAHLFQQIVV